MPQKSDIIEQLRKHIEEFRAEVEVESVGKVLSVGDGVARMSGLANVKSQEMLEFPDGTIGVTLNVEEETIGAIVLGDDSGIKEGDTVKASGRVLSVPLEIRLMVGARSNTNGSSRSRRSRQGSSPDKR